MRKSPVDIMVDAFRDAIIGSGTPDSSVRQMPDEDHKEIQLYSAVQLMRLEHRIKRIEIILLLLSVCALAISLKLLLMQ